MEKVLTISVAAYNVSAYITQNLNSILGSEEKDLIEVFVVDDGGKDNTLEIAGKFEQDNPGIIHAVHKENGGYGSVQNYSIAHASGKYFKILDGDDWVDTEGLTRLVRFLKSSDVDAVATNYYKGPDQQQLKEFGPGKKGATSAPTDPNLIDTPIGMWSLTYKTDILRKSGIQLPEHTLYTDRIYSTIPFSYVTSLMIMDYCVYCYRTGREGQSVSRESRIKHIDEYLRVTEILCRHYAEDRRENKKYVLLKTAAAYKVSIRALLLLPSGRENLKKLTDYEKAAKATAPDIYKKSASPVTRMGWIIRFLRATGYKGYWVLGKVSKKIIDY